MSATATNIGPKISVEGEAEYRRQMTQIIAQQKALTAELKATTSGFAADATAQEKAWASGAVLQKEIGNLSQALKEQQGMLDKAVAKYGENSKQALSYKAAVYKTTAQINDLKNELNSAESALDDTADAMDDAGQSGIKFGDIIKANVISDFIVDGIKELASVAKDLAANFVESAAEVRAESAQFSQTFGDLADEATAAIQNVADSANTLPTLLQPAATSIYAFARSSGATTAEAMDLMSQSMQVAVDSAAYYDKTLSETTETLQSFLKGNYENDAALGVSATETTRNAQAMEMFGKEFNDLTEIQKQQALLQMVLDAQELSGAMGQASREADSWSNVQGNLNEAWRQFSATQGQAMLDALIPAVQEVTDLLVGLTDGSLTAGEALQQAFGFISEQAAGLVSQLPDALGSLSNFVGSLAASIVSELPSAVQMIGSIRSSINSGLSSALPQIQEAAAGLVASLKQGIEANFPQLLDSGLQALTSFTAGLRENIGQIVDQGLSLILSLAQGIADGMPSLIEQVPQIVSNIAGVINDNMPKVLETGVQVIVTLGKGLIQAIPTLLANLPQILQAVYDVWTAMNWMQLGRGIVTSIANGVKSFAKSIGPSIKSLGDNIVSTFKSIQWGQLGSNIVTGIVNGVKSLASNVIPTIKSLGSSILNTFKNLDWKQLGYNVVNGIANGLKMLASSAILAVKSLGSSLLNVFKNIDWRQLGNAIITGIINVLSIYFSYGSGVIQAVVGLAQSMIDAFLSMDWLQLGQQIVQGLIAGIKGLASGAVDAILGVGDGIVAGLKNVLGIHSPSRVFKEIGENLMQGLSIGLKDSSGEVMETVDDIASELKTRFSEIQDAISTQQDISKMQFDAWLSGDGQNASSAEVAARQIESVTQQLQAQQSVLQAAQQAYTKMVDLYGAASSEAASYQKTLLEEAEAYQELQDQIDDLEVDQITGGYDDMKKSLDAATKRAKVDFEVWQSEYADTATESEQLQKQLEYQNIELENQAQVVEQAKATYQQLCDTYGETSDEADNYLDTLESEISTYSDLRDEVQETTDALEESQDRLKQLAEEADSFFSSANTFVNSVSSLGGSVSDLFDSLKNNPFNEQADASETTANKLEVLNAQYAAAVDEVEKLTMAFNESVRVNGAAAEQTQELADQLDEAESEASSLKDEINELSASMEEPGFSDFLSWSGDLVTNLISIGGGLADVITAAKDFGSAIKGLPAIGEIFSGLVGSGGIGAALSGIASTAGSAIGSIGSALAGLAASTGPVGIAIAAVAALGSAFLVATADGETLGEKLKNVFDGIKNTIGNLISTAFNWGRDLIQGMIDGIASMADTLFGWIGDIAQGIASFLHFSRPDQGPLREYEQWMPDMIEGMARGIRDNTWMLRDAAADTAQLISDRMTVPVNIAAAASGTQPAARNVSFSFGDIVVNGSGVTDVDELADRVIDRLTMQVQQQEAAYGLV